VPLHRITEAILVTKGLKYFPWGPHVGQPCVAEWCIAQNLLTNCSKEDRVTAHIQVRQCRSCWLNVTSFSFRHTIMPVHIVLHAGPCSGRAVQGVGLRPLACWDCGFESHRGHGCLSVVSVVCCQVEVSATGWSLVQRSPTDCSASLCVIKKPRKRGG
jgi:hypothetical protein